MGIFSPPQQMSPPPPPPLPPAANPPTFASGDIAAGTKRAPKSTAVGADLGMPGSAPTPTAAKQLLGQ